MILPSMSLIVNYMYRLLTMPMRIFDFAWEFVWNWRFTAGLLLGLVFTHVFWSWLLMRRESPKSRKAAASSSAQSGRKHNRGRSVASWHLETSKVKGMRQEEYLQTQSSIEAMLAKSLESGDGNSESCTWINIVVQRFFHSFAQLQRVGSVDFENIINSKLSSIQWPSYLAPVVVTDVNIGAVFPVLHHVKVLQWHYDKPIELESEITYQGDAHICLETQLCINVPVMGMATLPVELAVSNIKLHGSMWFQIDSAVQTHSISYCFVEPPELSFDLNSELGHKLTLVDTPWVHKKLLELARKAFVDHLTLPQFKTINFTFSTARSGSPSAAAAAFGASAAARAAASLKQMSQAPAASFAAAAAAAVSKSTPAAVPLGLAFSPSPLGEHKRNASGAAVGSDSAAAPAAAPAAAGAAGVASAPAAVLAAPVAVAAAASSPAPSSTASASAGAGSAAGSAEDDKDSDNLTARMLRHTHSRTWQKRFEQREEKKKR